jgi:hypothetical protein
MSVSISVWNPDEKSPTISAKFYDVIGSVIAAVVKHEDGSITLERDIAVSADNAEDNELAESVVKTIEAKLNEAFPDPNKPEPSKLWVPD